MDGWLTLRHAKTGGTQSIPDHPDALAAQQARGWVVVEDEPETPFVPPKPADDPDAVGEWVDLVHPELPGATNRVPRNADAINGALAAGWTYPEESPADAKATETPAETPAETPRRPRRGQQTPATAGNNDEPAGDGAQQEE